MNDQGDMVKRIPIDVWVVVCLGFLSAFIEFGIFLLVFTGNAHAPPERPGHALLNTISLTSDFSVAVDSLLHSAAIFLGTYGLLKLQRWAWWFVFCMTVYNTADTACAGSAANYPISACIAFVLGVATIVWLLLRRRLFLK